MVFSEASITVITDFSVDVFKDFLTFYANVHFLKF